MKTKVLNFSKLTFEYIYEKSKFLYRFTKRNNRDLKKLGIPVITVLFVYFAFVGFLMKEEMNPYLVVFSRVFTLGIAGSLLLFCFVDLIKTNLITPFKNIIKREKSM